MFLRMICVHIQFQPAAVIVVESDGRDSVLLMCVVLM